MDEEELKDNLTEEELEEYEKAQQRAKKDEEQKAGAEAATDLLDVGLGAVTGGATEEAKAIPIVGNAVKGAEKVGGDIIAAGDRYLNGGRFNKAANIAKKTGLLDLGNFALGMSDGKEELSEADKALSEATSGNKNADLKPKTSTDNKSTEESKTTGDKEKNKESSADSSGKAKLNTDSDKKDKDSSDESEEKDKKSFDFDLDKGVFFLIIGTPVILILVVFLVIIISILGVGEAIDDFWNGVKNFFTFDQQTLEEKYYAELQNIQNQINGKEHICIDVNLIAAALTVDKEWDQSLVEGDENQDLAEPDYKKMTKQIERLAYMQIKHVKYGWDNRINDVGHCKHYGESNTEEKVGPDTVNEFVDDGLIFKDNGLDSSTPELVAQHDLTGFAAFFTKKALEEKNYEYILYQPAAEKVCSQEDENGNCISHIETCDADLPTDTAELSIGDTDDILNTYEDDVFYWNLINSFIPDYYADYLPTEEPARTQKIIKIADDIYDLYSDLGPNMQCGSSGNMSYGYSNLCPQGITVENDDGSIDIVELEAYVAGVLSRENGWHQGDNIENLKAQAIAARTFALADTNYCTKSIKNNSTRQNYSPTNDPYFIRAANETSGMILTRNGNIFKPEYDAFCVTDNSNPNYYVISQKNQQVPKSFADANGAGWQYTHCLCNQSSVYTKDKYPKCYNNKGNYVDGGHGRGMSQIGARYLQDQGYTYDQILAYYYGDDVQLFKSIAAANLTKATSIASRRIDEILLENGSSIEEFNSYIASSIASAGYGTREGVVAAAISLINGFEERTGLKLPYQYGGGHSASTMPLGASGNWLKYSETGAIGLDCSSFITWAFYNAGFQMDFAKSTLWDNKGDILRGDDYDKGQPGDIIVLTRGHVELIVGVTEDKYIIAHASQTSTGLIIMEKSKSHYKNNSGEFVVDMTKYYNSHPRWK